MLSAELQDGQEGLCLVCPCSGRSEGGRRSHGAKLVVRGTISLLMPVAVPEGLRVRPDLAKKV